jgi:hypothetical protein
MAGSEQRPDDVEGHVRRYQDTEAVDEDQAVKDDTEGHGRRL